MAIPRRTCDQLSDQCDPSRERLHLPQLHFEPLLRALHHGKTAALIFAPGVSLRTASMLSSASVTISSTPFDMDRILATCDAAITQAGMGTASAVLRQMRTTRPSPGCHSAETRAPRRG